MSTYQTKTIDVKNQTEIQRYKSSLKQKKEKQMLPSSRWMIPLRTYADA